MDRTMVYIEGEASINSYEDAEGKPRTSFNIIQREYYVVCWAAPPLRPRGTCLTLTCLTKVTLRSSANQPRPRRRKSLR